jgi:hypothetical protein
MEKRQSALLPPGTYHISRADGYKAADLARRDPARADAFVAEKLRVMPQPGLATEFIDITRDATLRVRGSVQGMVIAGALLATFLGAADLCDRSPEFADKIQPVCTVVQQTLSL